MDLYIRPGAATDDAVQIDQIVSQIDRDMEVLNAAIANYISEGKIQIEWADNLKSNWQKYYTSDVPVAMEEMKKSAANLRLAVDETIKYAQERN